MMYEDYFGLKRRPFLSVPDTESFFPAATVDSIRQTAEQTLRRGSIPLIFGAAGTGKTLLLRLLQQSLEQDYTVSLLSNGRLETPKAFFLQLLYSFGLPLTNADETELRIQLIDHVLHIPVQQKPHGVVLLFDDAQFLSPSVIETVQQLLDCTEGSEPLFRTALAGTVELEENLNDPALTKFQQRVVSRLYLENFSRGETEQYILRQLEKKEKSVQEEESDSDASSLLEERRFDAPQVESTGGDGGCLFSADALVLVHHLTDGLPRWVNQLCDTSLQLAAERAVEQIDETLIQAAWAKLQQVDESVVAASILPPVSQPGAEELEALVARKKETLQLKTFDSSVEFGSLDEDVSQQDAAADENVLEFVRPVEEDSIEENEPIPFSVVKEYKPVYPLDDDEESETFILKIEDVERDTAGTKNVVCLPKRRGSLNRPAMKRFSPFHPNHSYQNVNRMMDNAALERYGAEVLERHPPFVRREPHYVYQTSETAGAQEQTDRDAIGYSDPSTGRTIVLNWRNAEQTGDTGFGTAYSRYEQEFETPAVLQPSVPDASSDTAVVTATVTDTPQSAVCRPLPASLEESFEETVTVPKNIVSVEELYRTAGDSVLWLQKSSGKSRTFFAPDTSLFQHQMETVLRRLVRAAEKIEQAADISENAGQYLQQTAEYVESEVQAALPAYTDLFQELTEFHQSLSSEMEQLRRETLQVKKPERRVLQIDRNSKATIDARSLFQ